MWSEGASEFTSRDVVIDFVSKAERSEVWTTAAA
jgi:hypothetical protein